MKVYNFLSRETYFALAAEAAAQGLPFVGHVPFAISAGEAAEAGQRSIEHMDAAPVFVGGKSPEELAVLAAQLKGAIVMPEPILTNFIRNNARL